jgi:hypothetical protein
MKTAPISRGREGTRLTPAGGVVIYFLPFFAAAFFAGAFFAAFLVAFFID